MIRRGAILIAVGLFLAGCDKDPARSMKIAASPPPPVDPAPVPPAVAPPAVAERSLPAASGTAPPATAEAQGAGSAAATGSVSTGDAATRTKPVPAARANPATAPAKKGAAQPSGSKEWHPDVCPIPPEGARGPSSLEVTGPCAFRHSGTFTCEARGDDFYISATRKAARGSTLMVYINVERFKGPGEYKDAQMFVSVYEKRNIYRWSNDSVRLTVADDLGFAVLPTTRLEAEPLLLVDCTGPMNNFFCASAAEHPAYTVTAVVAAGKLKCAPGARKSQPDGG
jgi:hypothetical protein